MNKEVFKIISETCLKHRDTGESSVFTETRRIIQALDKAGYDIVANEAKASTKSDIVCQECKNPYPHIDKNGLAGCEECGNTWQT